jgi:hypothetical protein
MSLLFSNASLIASFKLSGMASEDSTPTLSGAIGLSALVCA